MGHGLAIPTYREQRFPTYGSRRLKRGQKVGPGYPKVVQSGWRLPKTGQKWVAKFFQNMGVIAQKKVGVFLCHKSKSNVFLLSPSL